MRVLLIKPTAMTYLSPLKSKSNAISSPLGILQLASCLREYRRDDVQILDLRVKSTKGHMEHVLRTTLLTFKPHVIGLSMLTHEHRAGQQISRMIRACLPSVVIIAGGPHPTMYPQRTLKEDQNVNYIICGEGEHTFCELLEAFESGKDLYTLKGIGGRRDGQIFINPPQGMEEDLSRFPIPAWDLYDYNRYQYIDERMTLAHDYLPYAGIMTTRGCPYQCTYCHNIFGRKLRKRSVDHVLTELEYLKNLGIQSIEIYDDCFNFDKKHMRTILQEIIHRRLNIHLSFPNGLRADILSREDIELLKEAGTIYLAVAVETTSPRIQKLIQKNLNIDRVTTIIHASVKHRIFTHAFFMLGFPTETREEMEATIEYACRSRLHSAFFFKLIPHPATELGRVAGLNELDARIDAWNDYAEVPNLSVEPPEVVNGLLAKANRRFYISPRRILRVARDIPSWRRILSVTKSFIPYYMVPFLYKKYRWTKYDDNI